MTELGTKLCANCVGIEQAGDASEFRILEGGSTS